MFGFEYNSILNPPDEDAIPLNKQVIADFKRGVDISSPEYKALVMSGYGQNQSGSDYQNLVNAFGKQMTSALDSLINLSNAQTDKQNALQLQMMRESNSFTAAQAEKTRAFNAAEALKAFQRSEQSRLDAQEYNTNERLATQEFNSSEAQKQRDFEQYNADTQYQRAVKDLYAAGLNPLLAVGAQAGMAQGTAARSSAAHSSASSGYAASSSTPHGNSATAHRSNVENIISSVLGFLTDRERNEVLSERNTFNLLGKVFGSVLQLF